MFRFVPRITAALLLVLPVALAPAAADDRPFHASGAGLTSEYGLSAYEFEATHLGRAYFNGDLWEGLLDHSRIIHIPAYLTAANFDRLYLDCVVYYDEYTGSAIGTLTFSGGTGRADVMFDFLDAYYYGYHFDFLIDGSIDYRAR